MWRQSLDDHVVAMRFAEPATKVQTRDSSIDRRSQDPRTGQLHGPVAVFEMSEKPESRQIGSASELSVVVPAKDVRGELPNGRLDPHTAEQAPLHTNPLPEERLGLEMFASDRTAASAQHGSPTNTCPHFYSVRVRLSLMQETQA